VIHTDKQEANDFFSSLASGFFSQRKFESDKQVRRIRRLTQIIILASFLTLLTVFVGTGLAVYKNWEFRFEASKAQMVRTATMGNLLVESALIDAAKSLDITKEALESAMRLGHLENKAIYDILMKSLQQFSAYNNSDVLGLMFMVDTQGMMVARSGEFPSQSINFSDRLYFQDLRDHPHKIRTIGPLLIARTNKQWVFHMSVPIYDKYGHFAGVLVQQLLEKDIATKLSKYVELPEFVFLVTQYEDSAVSFTYPAPSSPQDLYSFLSLNYLTKARLAQDLKGADVWNQVTSFQDENSLVGFARSPIFGLMTFVSVPLNSLWKSFLLGNLVLFIYIIFGVIFIHAIFYYVFRLSIQLANAQDSALHDPLTALHNRRALDETLPHLLRDSIRSQQPISVLFIDIDFFRHFNEHYGHESGDVALQAVSISLATCCRRPMDFICRWGGEEFVAVLPHSNEMAAATISNAMLSAVRSIKLIVQGEESPQITVSIGCVTSIVGEKNLPIDLVDIADRAMQHAKRTGRNRCAVFDVANFIHHGMTFEFNG
jgi:diguanylate cyclase (GGDEF)-like protein